MTQKKLRVGVVFGSRSCEYDVSLHSAEAVLANLDTNKYDVVPIAITKEGAWLLNVTPEELHVLDEKPDEKKHIQQEKAIVLAGDPTVRDLLMVGNGKKATPLDVVFPVIHGPYGEDGTIQGLLEMADIPYVGGGVLGSAIGMDKEKMKIIFQSINLPMIDYLTYRYTRWAREPETILTEIEQKLGYPCIVKPVNMGSSIGVTRADDREALRRSITEAAEYDNKIMVERCLNIREISCSVLGNEEPATSPLGEIVNEENVVNDYDLKYVHPTFRLDIPPAGISPQMTEDILRMAKQAFLALELSGLARVDFFVDRNDQRIYINEANTMPGFTSSSVYASLWAAANLPYPQLLDRLIELALERHQQRQRLRRTY
jgi:D-alanine-D-alanine ligase